MMDSIPGTNRESFQLTFYRCFDYYREGSILNHLESSCLVKSRALTSHTVKYTVEEILSQEETENAIKHFKFLRRYNLA